MSDIPSADVMKDFNKSIVDEFRANDGKVGGQFAGANLLLLTTTGAKSGQPRLAPLAYFTIDGKLIIIGSKAGADTNPDWVHNLRRTSRSAATPMTSPAGNCPRPSATGSSTRSSPRRRALANTSPRRRASSRCSSCSASDPGRHTFVPKEETWL